MKKALVLILSLAITVGGVCAYASGGSSSDPLVSLQFLQESFLPGLRKKAEQKIDAGLQETYQTALNGLKAQYEADLQHPGQPGRPAAGNSAFLDRRYKRGDVLSLPTGSGVMLLAGEASAGYTADGAIIDVTAGQTVGQGAALLPRHRYLIGERTSGAVTITSDTAVLSTEGPSELFASTSTDYNALADALTQIGIFRGTGVAYGSGYQLELIPSRIEGLVMFLRLTGEEQAALAFTGKNPFVDTPAWCERYTAYAYAKGYTKGVGGDKNGNLHFGTTRVMTAGEYITFLLRALGYQDSGERPDFTWNTALQRSVDLRVLTAAEAAHFASEPFRRAQVAYTSYFALEAPRKEGGTLLSWLSSAGMLDGQRVSEIMASVRVSRMS